MSDPLEGVTWVDVRVLVHLYDWAIDSIQSLNMQDKESRSLVDAGLVEILDEETAAKLPPRPAAISTNGCGCGH